MWLAVSRVALIGGPRGVQLCACAAARTPALSHGGACRCAPLALPPAHNILVGAMIGSVNLCRLTCYELCGLRNWMYALLY